VKESNQIKSNRTLNPLSKEATAAKMPLPQDSGLVETAGNLVNAFKGAFGTPPGYRPGK
jgi:hypothetical protein